MTSLELGLRTASPHSRKDEEMNNECGYITKIRILNSLQVIDYKKWSMPKVTFILHTKDDDEYFRKYGRSWKGMNRLLRKCVGRLKP